MITNFKLFESQESILNDLLDKIQEKGKDSLTSNELDFLNNYPNGKLESSDDEVLIGVKLHQELGEVDSNDLDYGQHKKGISSYRTENFWFELENTDIDAISNSFIISGSMLFMIDGHERKMLEGYFLVNQETHQIFPYFQDEEGKTAYDYTFGNEDEFYDFLETIYEKNKPTE